MSEQDYDAFDAEMRQKYPAMFSQPFGGFDIDAGWWPIIKSLCANIQAHIDWWNANRKERPIVEQVVILQIKEKFGGLRFYYDGGDGVIRGMVCMAEEWAGHVCEVCGKPGEKRGGGWIKTLCDEHEAERQQRYREQFGETNV